jgi:HEAT repeat protein
MGTAEEQDSDTGRPANQDAGREPVGDSNSREVWMDQAVRNWEERAREVAERIARGELEQMVELLLDDDEDRRYEVARDIAKAGQAVVPRALELAEDPRPRMRQMACYILGQVGYLDPDYPLLLIRYPDGIPTLVRHLENDSDEHVRAAAAHALGFHRDEAVSAAPALCRAADDPSDEIRYAAAHALGSFGEWAWETADDRQDQKAVREALLRLMDDEDEDVRDWATFGIHQGSHDTPETRARLWQALDDPCPDVRGEAAAGLAKFGDRSLIPRLDQLLREDPALHSCFFAAAEELGDPSLLPAVLVGAERWRQWMEEGEELHYDIRSAIEALEKAVAAQRKG